MRTFKETHAWLDDIPNLVAAAIERWDLKISGPPLEAGISCVLPVAQNGQDLILKIQWPHKECAKEALALKVWNGICAPRLVGWDAETSTLLMEKIQTPHDFTLSSLSKATAELAPQMNVETNVEFDILEDEARDWARTLEQRWKDGGKEIKKDVVFFALDTLDYLCQTQSVQALIHQDLHEENILYCQTRGRLIVIDPKPLLGDPAFGVSRAILGTRYGDTQIATQDRVNYLSTNLNLSPSRIQGWALIKALNEGLNRPKMPVYCEKVAYWMAQSLNFKL